MLSSFSRLWPLALVLTLSGCRCGDRLAPLSTSLCASPASLDFGDVAVGKNATRTVLLVNQGGQPCQVSEIDLAPGAAPDFALPPGNPSSLTLPTGGSSTLTVSFVPAAGAPPLGRSASLTFATGDP